MWNFLIFLYFVCGAVSAFIGVKDTLSRKGELNAQDIGVIALLFFGGAGSLLWVVCEEGDKIVIFKKRPDPVPVQAAPPSTSSYVPPQSQNKQPRSSSVLDD